MCTIVETRGGTDTHSFFTHAVAQTYWHICIHAICQYLRIQYANICTCNMQIFANAILKYYSFDRHAVEVNRSYLLPLSQSSPAQGICKTAFLKHPGSFWLQKTGHGAWLTEVSLNFSWHFLGFPEIYVQLLRVLASYISSYIYDCWVNLGKRHKIW